MTQHHGRGNNWDTSWTLIYWLSMLHFCSLGGKRLYGLWQINANRANHNMPQICVIQMVKNCPFHQVKSIRWVFLCGLGLVEVTLWSAHEHNMKLKHTAKSHLSVCFVPMLFSAFQCCLFLNVFNLINEFAALSRSHLHSRSFTQILCNKANMNSLL